MFHLTRGLRWSFGKMRTCSDPFSDEVFSDGSEIINGHHPSLIASLTIIATQVISWVALCSCTEVQTEKEVIHKKRKMMCLIKNSTSKWKKFKISYSIYLKLYTIFTSSAQKILCSPWLWNYFSECPLFITIIMHYYIIIFTPTQSGSLSSAFLISYVLLPCKCCSKRFFWGYGNIL